MISFINAGTAAAVASGNATPSVPSSIFTNDILVLVIHSRDNVACSVSNNYTSKVVGNGNSTNRLEIWWKRMTGNETAPTITHTAGDSLIAQIFAYRGCIASGDPFDVVGTVASNAGSPISTAAITTTVNDCIILHAFGSQDDNTWGTFTGATTTSRGVTSNSLGTDNSMGVIEGSLSKYGSTGTAAATQASLGPDAGVSVLVALKPQFTSTFNNYQSLSAGDGISVGERVR